MTTSSEHDNGPRVKMPKAPKAGKTPRAEMPHAIEPGDEDSVILAEFESDVRVSGPRDTQLIVGTLGEVNAYVEGHPGDDYVRVVAVRTTSRGRRAAVDDLANVVERIAPLIDVIEGERDEQVLGAILRAMVPREPPTPTRLVEMTMLAESRKAILNGADWLKAKDIAELAHLSPTNPASLPNKWKRDGAIFAIRHNGVDYFPGYALDPNNGFRPLPVLAKIIKVLGGVRDSWGLASWLLAANSYLGGRRPQDLLASAPDRVVAAAEQDLAGVAHG